MVKNLALAAADNTPSPVSLNQGGDHTSDSDGFFIFTQDASTPITRKDSIDNEIDEYIRLVGKGGQISSTLGFWKAHEKNFPKLSPIAKKYLGVPASQASVERVFSVSGHIFSLKRRSMSLNLLEILVFLKLNEELLTVKK